MIKTCLSSEKESLLAFLDLFSFCHFCSTNVNLAFFIQKQTFNFPVICLALITVSLIFCSSLQCLIWKMSQFGGNTTKLFVKHFFEKSFFWSKGKFYKGTESSFVKISVSRFPEPLLRTLF